MIVPRYWAESKTVKTIKGRQFTLKRFGWSDASEADAKSHADQRLQEAVETLETEGDVRRIDHKIAYNGAEGIPIREEVVSSEGDTVISRNSYGALCLNTPDVMFVDIDYEYESTFSLTLCVFSSFVCLSIILATITHSWLVFIIAFTLSLFFSSNVANKLYQQFLKRQGGVERKALENIKSVIAKHPELNIRVYKTPKGLRLLVMNDTYDPKSDHAVGLLDAFDSDIFYIHMCKNQNCFRARLSPKPWRIGVDRIRPRPGIWPVKEERLEERKRWVEHYEKESTNYSACHFLMKLGSDTVSPKAEAVRELHDKLSGAEKVTQQLA